MKRKNLEIERVKKMKNFDWERPLGENIVVFHNGCFYKRPSIIGKNLFYNNEGSYHTFLRNFQLINEYFGEGFVIVDTKIFCDDKEDYIIRQKKLDLRSLTLDDIKNNSCLNVKFSDLIEINDKMWKKEKMFLDILGTDYLFNPIHIHNLMTDGYDIYIFDFGLLDGWAKNLFFRVMSRFFYRLQVAYIRKFILKFRDYSFSRKVFFGMD